MSGSYSTMHDTVPDGDNADPYEIGSGEENLSILGTPAWTSVTPAIIQEYANFQRFAAFQGRNVHAFFRYWSLAGLAPLQGLVRARIELASEVLCPRHRAIVTAHDLSPGENIQGISFDALGTCQNEVEKIRHRLFRPHLSNPNFTFRSRESLRAQLVAPRKLSRGKTSHFRFRQTNLRCKPIVPHFQLRHSLSAVCKTAVFYARGREIICYNPEADTRTKVFEVQEFPSTSILRQRIDCLEARDELLIAGDVQGHYTMKCLSKTYDDPVESGVICDGPPETRMTNHVAIYPHRRSGLPQATFCSNDNGMRTMDCHTARFVDHRRLDWPVNCTATSPDGRLRLVVGDACEPLVMDAERGEVIHRLPNHDDYGFACDWADDGLHMCTANQDGKTQIWDCRNLSRPLRVLPAEMMSVRTVKFSSVGSGQRILVLAEDADYVSIVDATTFDNEQRFSMLGEISGISLLPEGDKLFVGVADDIFAGIVEFDRCDYGYDRSYEEKYYTWQPDEDLGEEGPIQILDPDCYQDWSSETEALSHGPVI